MDNTISFEVPLADQKLSEFINNIKEEKKTEDIMTIKCRQLECLSRTNNLYESAVLERLSENLEDNNNGYIDFSDDIPMITPWFTPDEMEDLFNIEVDPYEYLVDGSKSMKLHEEIRKAMIEGRFDDVIKLGWNPSVPYNESSMSYARKRQIKWFNEKKNIQIVDISDLDFISEKTEDAIVELEPIYITLINHGGINSKIIRGWTHSRWSHAGISLDEEMNHIYSYNFHDPTGKSGFSIENLNFYGQVKDPHLKVVVFFVEPKTKSKLREVIRYYEKNIEKTTYSTKNIIKLVLHKAEDSTQALGMICSQFVDNVLKMVNLDLTGKPSNLVAPADFERSSSISKMFTVFDGPVKDYKAKITKRKIINLLRSKLNPDGLILKPLEEVVNNIIENKSLDFIYCTTNNIKVDKVLTEIRKLLIPTSIILEAKPLPIRFGKSGNLFIELPKDLEAEYQQSHRLLASYSENNMEGIKHQLARLFYINSIIEKKIRRMKKGDKDYKDLIDLRARVINDFKKYIIVVQKLEENFDFEQYIKNSEYYDKTVVIDKHTMKYTGSVIKNMIKLMK